jgi:hypothetical protein
MERVAAAGDPKAKAFLQASAAELDVALPARAAGQKKEAEPSTDSAAPVAEVVLRVREPATQSAK